MLELQINISKNILYHECGETNVVQYLQLWSTSLNCHLKFKNQTKRKKDEPPWSGRGSDSRRGPRWRRGRSAAPPPLGSRGRLPTTIESNQIKLKLN